MTRRRLYLVVEIAVPILLVALWFVGSATSENFYFPPLSQILSIVGGDIVADRLGEDIVPSLVRALAGFGIACVVGVVVGVAMGMSRALASAVKPVTEFLRALPPPILFPLCIAVLGIGDSMKVVVIAFGCLWPILLNAMDGIRSLDPVMDETGRSFSLGPWRRFVHIRFPNALPQIFAGMRSSISLAIILMVISEMVGSTNGLGYLILSSQRSFAIGEMWAGILVLGVMGYLMNFGFLLIERYVLAWHYGRRALLDA